MKPYYQDASVTIYHGDCREILPTMIADAVITDPPYSAHTHLNAKTNRGKGTGVNAIDFAPVEFADVSALLSTLGASTRGWCVASLDWRHAVRLDESPPNGLRLMRVGVWVKPNPMPQISADRPAQGWEAIAYLHRSDVKPSWLGGGAHGNYWLPTQQSNDHPTQKPLAMLQSLVSRFSPQAGTVLDPFMGSGTTLVAAKDTGRRAIGIEIDERYCEIAARRCSQEVLALDGVNNHPSGSNPDAAA